MWRAVERQPTFGLVSVSHSARPYDSGPSPPPEAVSGAIALCTAATLEVSAWSSFHG